MYFALIWKKAGAYAMALVLLYVGTGSSTCSKSSK